MGLRVIPLRSRGFIGAAPWPAAGSPHVGGLLDSPHGYRFAGLHRAGAGAARAGPPRTGLRFRPAGRALLARTSRPPLPDARLGARRRRTAPGHAAAGLARAARGPRPPVAS